jgi:hypothetical protein
MGLISRILRRCIVKPDPYPGRIGSEGMDAQDDPAIIDALLIDNPWEESAWVVAPFGIDNV